MANKAKWLSLGALIMIIKKKLDWIDIVLFKVLDIKAFISSFIQTTFILVQR